MSYPTSRLALLLALTACCSTLAHVAELFGPAGVSFAVGDNPGAVASGDFNADGLRDLAIVNRDDNTVSILLGDRLGDFQRVIDIELGPASVDPAAIAAGDLDLDGATDLVVVSSGSGNVSVLLSDGTEGFQDPFIETVGGFPFSLTIGDVNNDGLPDVAVADFFGGQVALLPGDGTGQFGASSPIQVGGFPFFLAVADLNDDELSDLAIAYLFDDEVQIWLADGAGGFGSGGAADVVVPVGDGPRFVSVAHFDEDPFLDLAVANGDGDSVSIRRADGSGGFELTQDIAMPAGPRSMATADLNGDGALDLAVVAFEADALSVLLGDGSGRFARVHELGVGGDPEAVIADEFNGDGAFDLAVASSFNDAVSVLFGTGLGGFERAPEVAAGDSPRAVAIGAFNADPAPDLVVANNAAGTVTLLLGDGVGGFGRHLDRNVGAGPVALVVSDLTGDGQLDVAVANQLDDSISVLLGDGRGGLAASASSPITLQADPGDPGDAAVPSGLAVGDFDEDGDPDLAVANQGNGSVSILLGDGSGGFTETDASPIDVEQVAVEDGPWSVAVDDFDGNGHSDLVLASVQPPRLTVLLGDGSGEFPEIRFVTVEESVGTSGQPTRVLRPFSVVPGQFDADETVDLLVIYKLDDSVGVLLGGGDGSFSVASRIDVSADPISAAVADFNGDGLPDVAVGNEFADSVSLLVGDGLGGFVKFPGPALDDGPGRSAQPDLAVSRRPKSLAAGDLNLDGAPDLVVAVSGADGLNTLFNRLAERADPNGSNRIDGFDISEIGRRWGQATGDPDYRRSIDVDLNGVIEGDDLSLVGMRFGQLRRIASPLRPGLVDRAPGTTDTVLLVQTGTEGDLVTLELSVDAGNEAIATADFAVDFAATDAGPGQILEVAGFEPGACVSGGAAQSYEVVTNVTGRVGVAISSLPAVNDLCGQAPLLRLIFRALREGEVSLSLGAHRQPAPGLYALEPAGGGLRLVQGLGFAGDPAIEVDATAGGPPSQKIGFVPERLDFGSVPTGTMVRRILRISNFGFSPLTLRNIAAVTDCGSGTAAPDFDSFFTVATEVPAYGFVELTVTYEPTAAGNPTAALEIATSLDPGDPPSCVPLQAAAIGP